MNLDISSTYHRVLIKLSGEALMGEADYGIDPQIMQQLAREITEIIQLGTQVGLVIGGGNIFRGAGLTKTGINRVTADQMGMLATVINAMAMQDFLQREGVTTHLMSAIPMETVCESYNRQRAVAHLEKGQVVIFAAGTGNPFFTTDSAASLRAIEIEANLLIKATKVDGVYTADPVLNPTAKRFSRLSYDEVLQQKLAVMDLTAIVLCRDNRLALRVLNMTEPHTLLHAVQGQEVGTLICH